MMTACRISSAVTKPWNPLDPLSYGTKAGSTLKNSSSYRLGVGMTGIA